MSEEKKELIEEENKEVTNEGVKELTEDELLAKKKKNMLMIIIGLVILLILLMLGVYFIFIKDDEVPLAGGEGDSTSVVSISSAEPEPEPEPEPVVSAEPEPVHEHTRGEWVTAKEATCTEDGKEEEICPDCKEVLDERPISATGHKWRDVTETIHHDATYEERWVIDEGEWDEVITEGANYYECSCGQRFDSRGDAVSDHLSSADYSSGKNHSVHLVEASSRTIHHDAVGHYENWLVDQAYDETIVTGQQCAECGATR